jgi:hypothetical protein
MEQHLSGLNDANNIPSNLPNDLEEPGSAEQAADLIRKQTTGPVPLGPATPEQAADEVVFIETISESEPIGIIALTEENLAGADADTNLGIDMGADLEVGVPWYQSRWMYLGAGLLVASAAVTIGSVLLVRGLNRRNRGVPVMRRVSGSLSRATPRTPATLNRLAGQLSQQTSRVTSQVQERISRLARSSQGAGATLKPLRRQANGWGGTLINRTQQQLNALSAQAQGQMRSVTAATRATTTRAMSKTQEGVAQVGKNVAAGAEKTRAGLRRGWKLSRASLIGAAAGVLWAYLYAQQSGETTRQRLNQLLPRQVRNQH